MNKKFSYIFITYDMSPAPIAVMLQREGRQVLISQIENAKDLGVESGLSSEESPEIKKRRLSIYDGILVKTPFNELLKMMEKIPNKDEYFVVLDFNNLYKIADKVQKMGFTKGFFPTKEDFEREKDRNASKEFVKKHYPKIKVAPVHSFKKVDDAIEFLNQAGDKMFALKSDGNFVDTVVPLTKNEGFAKDELIFQLKKNQSDYEKGFTLEEKIIDPIEVAPQIVFWDGKPIYYSIDMETRMVGPNDVGFQTGGNQNIHMAVEKDDPIIRMSFPPEVFKIAKEHKGMFIFDCGLLFDKKGDAYFTEFAGNRWGWPGVFSELSMSRTKDACASEYFETLAAGKNPQKFKFGSTMSIYNLSIDKKYPGLYKDGMPVQWEEEVQSYFFPYQVRKDMTENENEEGETEKKSIYLNVGYAGSLSIIGSSTGCGMTFKEAVDLLYKNLIEKVYMGGMYFRSKEDFLSTAYPTAIQNRINYLVNNKLASLKMIAKAPEEVVESYAKVLGRTLRK
jgi:hypothetical protein